MGKIFVISHFEEIYFYFSFWRGKYFFIFGLMSEIFFKSRLDEWKFLYFSFWQVNKKKAQTNELDTIPDEQLFLFIHQNVEKINLSK